MFSLLESTSPQKQLPLASTKFEKDLERARQVTNQNIKFDTMRKYCYGFKRYMMYVYVHVKGREAVSTSDLIPAQPNVVRAFLQDILDESESYNQVRAAKTAITYFHQRAGHSEAMQHEFMTSYVKGVAKMFQVPPEPARCPIDSEIRQWMNAKATSFPEIRTQAILALMLGSGIRLDSTLSLTPYDLQQFIGELQGFEEDEETTRKAFTLDKVKTDSFRNSHLKQLVGKHSIGPVSKYLRTIGLTSHADLDNYTAAAPVFRQAHYTADGTRQLPTKVTDTEVTNVKPVSKSTLQKDYKKFQQKFSPGLPLTTFHAARSKFAAASAEAGAGQLFIQRLRQWKSSCFLRRLDSTSEQDAEQLRRLHDSLF